MMKTWSAYHVYTRNLDRLILECVQPFLDQHDERLERRFWERHSAGGPHIRVRLQASPETLDDVGRQFCAVVEAYLARHPGSPLSDYSEERARALLDKEQASYTDDDVRYRNNEVVAREFSLEEGGYASLEAATFMADFHHDATQLATLILSDARPRREAIIRLFFLHPILAVGEIKNGSVSWKSHWEGFAATFSEPRLLERIRDSYAGSRDTVLEHLTEVLALAEDKNFDQDPVLSGWVAVVKQYRARARRELAAGHVFTTQPTTVAEAGQMRAKMKEHLVRDSSFVRTFWSDDQFLTALQHDLSFQVPRVMVNLFYNLVARVGLSPLDKMVLCHHAQRAVEEYFQCDLQVQLEHNMAAVVRRRAEILGSDLVSSA